MPDNYSIYRVDRDDGRRGGTVALIYKNSLKIKTKEVVKYVQFEYLICNLVTNNSSVSLTVVYRPPPSQENLPNNNTFLVEWEELLSDFTTTSEVVIVGDHNIHFDNTTHHHTIAMEKTVESFDLQQHVHQPTHYCGHTLDVLVSRDNSTIVSNNEVKDIGFILIGYEPADLTVHPPPPRMIESGFIFFVWVSSATKNFSSKKSGFCRRC